MSSSAEDITNRAKSLDYMLRSIVSGILAIGLVGAIIVCTVMQIPLDGTAGQVLNVSVGMVIGFFFANNATVNGSMLRSLPGSRSTDTKLTEVCAEVAKPADPTT